MKNSIRLFASLAVLSLLPLVASAGQSEDERDEHEGTTTLPVGNYEHRSLLPTGQFITPTAAPGSSIQVLATELRTDGNADASEAVNSALSPDGKTLLVMTSGWNKGNQEPNGTPITFPTLDPITGATVGTTSNDEWVFVFHIGSDGAATKVQQINIPDTYSGLTWAPDGFHFYVSGGDDDRVYVYKFGGRQYVPDTPFILLGHNSNQTAPIPKYDGSLLKGTKAAAASPALVRGAVVAGVAVSRDGRTLVAANFENDSLSIVDTSSRKTTREVHFFMPGDTVAQGEFPYDAVILSDREGAARTAYVTSQRDDQVMVVDIKTGNFSAIAVGAQPNRLLLSRDQSRLYVVNGNNDSISEIDTSSQRVERTLKLSRPGDRYKGLNANSAAISPDGNTLYVTLGTENSVAVVNLRTGELEGRIPTGWYPTSVSVSTNGSTIYVSTFKSNSGPNPGNAAANPTFLTQRSYPLEKAQLNTIPVPSRGKLEELTEQVDKNNGLSNRRDDPKMAFLQNKIHHVIYIIKENKTYDQMLGDLERGNGDPSLNQWPQPISPNHHSLALTFGLLDNFYATAEVSGTGWDWSTYGHSTEYNEKTVPVNYGNGGSGVTSDSEGTNRFIGVGLPEFAKDPSPLTERLLTLIDPTGSSNILPGTKNVDSPEGANDDLDAEKVGGYLWDSALRAHKTVRNYGFYLDQSYYISSGGNPTTADPNVPTYIPISPTPFAAKIPQAIEEQPALLGLTDIYYRGFDQNNADTYLVNEWQRDMAVNGLPNLTLLRLPHDHNGSFGTAIAGLGTAALQISDNDYAIGRVVDIISHSPNWRDTAIFILEDDAQNGSDHVDSHRSFAYVISPYSRRGVTISTNYNTVNVLRTIEDVMGISHLNFRDADAAPMADVFTRKPDYTPYSAIIPGDLCVAPVDPNLVPECQSTTAQITSAAPQLRDSAWWAAKTKGFDFSDADRVDADAFNRILWQGTMGDTVPYPTIRSHQDLRQNRALLIKHWRASKAQSKQTSTTSTGGQ
ncbi:alkaline phosphatase family protein [Tunturiibacter gelidoferens]|uniref:YVTN family beta-propeller protein n=1 Tax=Tunturiibacter gelidiferens TaxID=3069689 RepID=A0A9X0U728_9BACT|nr:alkaline phosphatase family protein [Edaphobacter lichenicola]MBB5331705.1 YVTN family beta-propeller protein [Edaphobacter lichenicola]